MTIVVLGGFGNFGARICRALAGDDDLTVIAASRRPPQAASELTRRATPSAALDIHSATFARELKALAPKVVLHCVGPFQGQGYGVARAALACGAHYIDLADGRDFVAGFSAALHDDAVRAGRLAVTGASTLPALSSAVVDQLAAGFARLDDIDVVIAPAQRAPRGAATLAGVLSYAGQAFDIWRDGRWQTAHGWLDVNTVDLGPLGRRRSALCDVPDLALFPTRYPGTRNVRFRAALEVGVQHAAIAGLAILRRACLPLPPARIAAIAPTLERMAGLFNWLGSETGGMTVTLTGLGREGEPRAIRWHVLAPDSHGPEIPCMAAILLARKLARGELPRTGAMPCMGLLSLDAFAPEFAKWGMTSGMTELP